MTWKTYLVLYIGTDARTPSECVKELEDIGFKTSFGPVDLIYEWEEEPTKEQVLELADKISETLKGSGAVFNLDTHD